MNQFHREAHDLLKNKLGITVHDHVHVAPDGQYASRQAQGTMAKSGPPAAYQTTFQGLPLAIETPIGEARHWQDKETGEDGHTTMTLPYGYVRGTLGMDQDAVDAFVGPDASAPLVYLVTTNKAPEYTEVDEQKAMLGFRRQADATEAFLAHYGDDPRHMRAVTAMPLDEFKARLKSGQYRGKPLA